MENGFCPGWVLSEMGFVRDGFCPRRVMSGRGFVRTPYLHIYNLRTHCRCRCIRHNQNKFNFHTKESAKFVLCIMFCLVQCMLRLYMVVVNLFYFHRFSDFLHCDFYNYTIMIPPTGHKAKHLVDF